MNKEQNKKNLSGLAITLIGAGFIVFSFVVVFWGEFGEILSGLFRVVGIIMFIIGLLRWNNEIKNKKKAKNEKHE